MRFLGHWVRAGGLEIHCPTDVIVECTGPAGSRANFRVVATNTLGIPIVSATCNPPSGSLFKIGTTPVKCTAQDSRGNTSSCVFNVSVRDTQAPVISVPSPIEISCAPAGGQRVDFAVTARDNCDTQVVVLCDPPSGGVFPVGVTTVHCQTRDGSGNAANRIFTVRLRADTVPPVLTVPADFAVDCESIQGRKVDFSASAFDECDGAVKVACTPPSGSIFSIGTHRVIGRAVDKAGNGVSKFFLVTVNPDTTPPSLEVPTDVSVNCTSPNGAVVDFSVKATDNCGLAPKITFTKLPGSLFPIGTTQITCIATDAAGNQVVRSFPVTVRGGCEADCLAIHCPTIIEVALDTGAKAQVFFTATATNLCRAEAVPVYCKPGSGFHFPVGVTTVQCAATNRGNVKKCSFTVTVRDSIPPKLVVPSGLVAECQGFDLQASGAATVNYIVKATDNSGLAPQISCNPSSGSSFKVGTHTVICIATDSSGNTATNTFPITVKSGPKCEVDVQQPPELAPDNWGFELGLLG